MEKVTSARRAISAFQKIVDENFSEIVRDATIQRFEFTFEACWKALKWFLKEYEGLNYNSPKSCFRAAFDIGLVDEETGLALLAFTDDHNLTAHTYIEAVAIKIYEKRHEQSKFLETLITRIEQKLS